MLSLRRTVAPLSRSFGSASFEAIAAGVGNPSSKWTKKRTQPVNTRQTGDVGPENAPTLCLEMRLRKSPFFAMTRAAGCWAYSVYNKTFLPKAYFPMSEGGLMAEYDHLCKDVAMYEVAIERQVLVKGPDAVKFVDMVITRRASSCEVGRAKYVILCNGKGGVLNDPVLLRIAENEFWFSLADSDICQYLQGVQAGLGLDVEIVELDVSPVQIQGPKSTPLMTEFVGGEVDAIPYYGLLTTQVAGCTVTISRTGFSAEKGYEIYLHNASEDADKLWNAIMEVGKKYNLRVTGTSHIRRIEAGILSYGQDIDIETNPFEIGMGWQVDFSKENFIGKDALAKIKADGVTHKLCGLMFEGGPITYYPENNYLVYNEDEELVGHMTSAWFSPSLGTNAGFAFVPVEFSKLGTKLSVKVPELYNPGGGLCKGAICKTPFKKPAEEAMTGTGLRKTGLKL